MILDRKRKLIVILNSRTGSTSLSKMFHDSAIESELDFGKDNQHWNWCLKRVLIEAPDIEEEVIAGKYRVFSFYREPIERFLSGMGHHYRMVPHLMRENMTIEEYDIAVGFFAPQYHFLHMEGVEIEWFRFDDYVNEVIRLAAIFGLDITEKDVPWRNEALRIIPRESLTAEEITTVKDFYKMDYDLFASKGITFK